MRDIFLLTYEIEPDRKVAYDWLMRVTVVGVRWKDGR